jgi:hypothetical protein
VDWVTVRRRGVVAVVLRDVGGGADWTTAGGLVAGGSVAGGDVCGGTVFGGAVVITGQGIGCRVVPSMHSAAAGAADTTRRSPEIETAAASEPAVHRVLLPRRCVLLSVITPCPTDARPAGQVTHRATGCPRVRSSAPPRHADLSARRLRCPELYRRDHRLHHGGPLPRLRSPPMRGTARVLGIYLATRLLFLGVSACARVLVTPSPGLSDLLSRWDAAYYITLATRGYPKGDVLSPNDAFFPLYPLSVRFLDDVLPQGANLAAILLSVVAGGVAVVALWHVAARLANPRVADTTVVIFCLFPGTLSFLWPYADAMFLAFECAAILLLLQDRWPAAAVVTAFATATRPSGLALVVACAWVAWASGGGPLVRRALRAAGAAAISASGFLAYMAWLGVRTGDARRWFRVERELFGEGTPWKRLPTTIGDIARDGAQYARVMVLVLVAIAVVLLVVGLLADQPGWAKAITVIALYVPITANIATGSPRLQLAAVPAFVALAARLRGDVLLLWCGGSAALAAVLVYTYGLTLHLAP